MAKKGKVGKQRKDKFYQLAKEAGYRARSAFKLIQLNRKFDFLSGSRVLVDLCAAPGGWLQVAAKNMPVSSTIIGVDLVRIQPIRNVVTLQEDITTGKCRAALKAALNGAKADCVLHDGAPNVGMSWARDAYSQSELVLSAVRVATEHLLAKGWFVTKIFRSKDYQALIWVFKQLFDSVHATKPSASRNESAEIFVVCKGYKSPDRIDARLLDPREIFKDVELVEKARSATLASFEPRKKKAEGYEDGDMTQYHRTAASAFMGASDPINFLLSNTEIAFSDSESREFLAHKATTGEIQALCRDLRVLGKSDVKALLRWRLAMRDYSALLAGNEGNGHDDNSAEAESNRSEEDSDKDIDAMEDEAARQAKRLKRKVHKKKVRQRELLALKAAVPHDVCDENLDQSLFSLTQIKSGHVLERVIEGAGAHDLVDTSNADEDDPSAEDLEVSMAHAQQARRNTSVGAAFGNQSFVDFNANGETQEIAGEHVASSAEDTDNDDDDDSNYKRRVENELERLYDLYKERKRSVLKSARQRLRGKIKKGMEEEAETHVARDATLLQNRGALEHGMDEVDESEPLDDEGPTTPPLLLNVNEKPVAEHEAIQRWFSQEEFAHIPESSDDEDPVGERAARVRNSVSPAEDREADSDEDDDVQAIRDMKRQRISRVSNAADDGEFLEVPAEELGTSDDSEQESNADAGDGEIGSDSGPERKEAKVLDPAGLAIAARMTSARRKADIIDEAYTRYTFSDGPLPTWFSEEEAKHARPLRPVTREMVDEYKRRALAIDARPIKKVVEAKARKRMRIARKLERAKQATDRIMDSDLTAEQKQRQVEKIMAQAVKSKKAKGDVKYVVSTKGGTGGRPKGVKGRYRVVDRRMKKDKRALKKAKRGS